MRCKPTILDGRPVRVALGESDTARRAGFVWRSPRRLGAALGRAICTWHRQTACLRRTRASGACGMSGRFTTHAGIDESVLSERSRQNGFAKRWEYPGWSRCNVDSGGDTRAERSSGWQRENVLAGEQDENPPESIRPSPIVRIVRFCRTINRPVSRNKSSHVPLTDAGFRQ